MGNKGAKALNIITFSIKTFSITLLRFWDTRLNISIVFFTVMPRFIILDVIKLDVHA